MSTLTLWLTIAGAAAVTFALRLSFIALLGRMEIPLFLGRALRFVPAAVLTAVVIPPSSIYVKRLHAAGAFVGTIVFQLVSLTSSFVFDFWTFHTCVSAPSVPE